MIASRTGIRLTFSAVAISSCGTWVPGLSTPARICCRTYAATWSALVGRFSAAFPRRGGEVSHRTWSRTRHDIEPRRRSRRPHELAADDRRFDQVGGRGRERLGERDL